MDELINGCMNKLYMGRWLHGWMDANFDEWMNDYQWINAEVGAGGELEDWGKCKDLTDICLTDCDQMSQLEKRGETKEGKLCMTERERQRER